MELAADGRSSELRCGSACRGGTDAGNLVVVKLM